MPAIITDKFRLHNASQFEESFTETNGNTYYLGIGRPIPYATSTRGDSRTENLGTDASPITPADAITDQLYAYDDLLAVKKVTSADITFAVPRRNWTTGTIYDMYRHDYGNRVTGTTNVQQSYSQAVTLFNSTFYVKNSANRVYKCLFNNNNAASTDEPTTTSPSAVQTTSDGYKWKFMYELTAAQIANFTSTDFMPVATDATVANAATDGNIQIITIKSAGTGGTNGTHTGIPIRGDGSGGTCSVTIASGAVSSVVVTGTPINYTFAYIRVADINSAGGGSLTGAELDCIIEPQGGHGKDAVKELGGFFIMMNQSLEGTEAGSSGDYAVDQDFRRIVLIKDPKSGGSAATATTLRATKAIRFASSPTPGTFQVDEEINQASTGAVGKVVQWDATNRILYYVQTRFNDEGIDTNGNQTAFSGANIVTGQTSSATGTPDTSVSSTVNNVVFSSGYSSPEIDHDSGEVLYLENRAPVVRAADQTENIKLIVEF